MGMKKTFRSGFILYEILVSTIVILAFVSATAGMIIALPHSSVIMKHRLEAVQYAASVASRLMFLGSQNKDNSLLSVGTHTDLDICALPTSFFKDSLSGEIKYVVSEKTMDPKVKARLVEVIVTWKEKNPTKQLEERLTVIVFCRYG